MLLFKLVSRLVPIVLVSSLALAGCTLRPVYDGQDAGSFAVSYADPSSKIEQSIIEELRFRIGKSSSPLYEVDINASTSTRGLFSLGSSFARNETEARVTGTFILTKVETGEQVATASRFGTAVFQENTQKIAVNTARDDAYDRAAKDVARQLQLLIAQAITKDKN
ncbi:hypothetical protein [Maritalea sp.]|uniref:hypothetical protein n=1 Tax=Maritalea sp. TaxID=2003361 RepID=UPI003EF5C638